MGKLSLQQRPDEVALWGRQRDTIPSLTDVQKFQQKWITWWVSCQPKWRSSGTWPYPHDDVEDRDWTRLNVTGPHGLFAVVVSTSWWAAADEESRASFDAAVEDLHWVIKKLIHFNSGSQVAEPRPITTTETHFPGHGERNPGKRKVKPTAKVYNNH